MGRALLLSGGIDSIALAYLLRPLVAITIDYGQKSAIAEIQAAKQVCLELGLEHLVRSADCSSVGSGDLAGSKPTLLAPVPEWWPFRNQLLITIAAAAVIDRAPCILCLGTVSSDGAHVDGTAVFIDAMSQVLSLQEGGITLEAPAIGMSSPELVRHSGIPSDLLAWAHSCHTSSLACGQCRGCIKHFNTMQELGVGAY